ncbi:MAG TPA: TonB-dependent receptor [Candidatus Binatia bacterium]|nr:TonB-dependent receptor [Candidatus Binatia bacterium]
MIALAAAATRAGAAEERPHETLGEVLVTAPPVVGTTTARDPTAFATVVDTRSAPTSVTTLAEALADTVGVQVRRFGGLGDFSTVSIRGSSAGQVQIYLDGVPLSRAENEVVNLSDLPLDAVDHVEVYRGATPLGFAQAGPGGVVNVVTRRPGDTPVTAASASYGSFDTRKVDLTRSARVGSFEYLAFGHYLGSAGDFRFTNDRGTTATTADDREETRRNNGFDLGDLTARVGWRPGGPFAAMLTSDTFYKTEGVPGVGIEQARHTRLSTFREVAHLDGTLATLGTLPASADVQAYVLHERDRFEDRRHEISFVATDVESRTTATGVQALLRGALGAHQVPSLFLAASHERFASDDRFDPLGPAPDRTRVHGTVAGEDEIVLFRERLSLVPGLRWEVFRDDFPGDGRVAPPFAASGVQVRDFLVPRLGVRLEVVPRLTLLANVGRYAREPNLMELFGDRGVLVGNPRLQPEVAFNRDAGLRWTPAPRGPLAQVAFEYAYFDNDIDDLIVLVQNSQRIVRPENVTSAHVRGHEVALRARLFDRIGFAGNYTHQDARDVGDVTFLRGKQLPGRPADEAFAHVEYGWPARGRLWPGRVFYEANVIADDFLDRANVRRVESRVLHDFGVEVGLPRANLRATFEVKNAFDDRTRDVLGFPLPGRGLFVTLAWGLGQGRGDAR